MRCRLLNKWEPICAVSLSTLLISPLRAWRRGGLLVFYTHVFRRNVLWNGDVRPSDSPSVRVSVRPFSALFSYMLWHIELKFRTWLCFNVLQIKIKCRHFASIFEGVMPLCELRSKREVPRGVRNSKVRRQDKFRRDWSRHKNTCKSLSGTGPGVRRSKRPLLACRTRCICSMETLHN